MRLKLGRPEISKYADRFDVPRAGDVRPSVTFLGVATLLIDDGESAVMTDGFFTRPGLRRVLLGKIAPDLTPIDECLSRAGTTKLDAVLPVHTHFDHALDSAVVAEVTGATLVGGESAANIGRGQGLDGDQVVVAVPGEPAVYGAWTITLFESEHCPPDRFPGTIDEPVVPPAKVKDYKCGEAWSILLRHRDGASLLVQGSAGYLPGALAEQHADVVYLGVGQLGIQSEDYLRDYWEHTVRAVGARRVVLIHWDDFFRPLDQPLRALPYAGDDLDFTMEILGQLAAADGVPLHLPTVWERENPWA